MFTSCETAFAADLNNSKMHIMRNCVLLALFSRDLLVSLIGDPWAGESRTCRGLLLEAPKSYIPVAPLKSVLATYEQSKVYLPSTPERIPPLTYPRTSHWSKTSYENLSRGGKKILWFKTATAQSEHLRSDLNSKRTSLIERANRRNSCW